MLPDTSMRKVSIMHVMRTMLGITTLALTLCGLGIELHAEDRAIDEPTIRQAIQKSLPLLEKGARGSMAERKQCFTCHNQGLPILAMTLARTRGFSVDSEHLQSQLVFIADFLRRNRERYLDGSGTGGRADTAGYALWTLSAGNWKALGDPDDPTPAVAQYLLGFQAEKGYWPADSHRPPTENSDFTTTFLAARGLKFFGTNEQSSSIATRFTAAREWLRNATPRETEDHVFRLRAFALIGDCDDVIPAARDQLLSLQRPDGGWAQLPDSESDAYATGSVLAALLQAANLAADHESYQKGLRYLLQNQQSDGSWHVVSRSKPFQTYFESGYPHGKDQFISIAAGSWATMALTLALPESTVPRP